MMPQHFIMHVQCWQRRCLIGIIDVAGWQGNCESRHYTVVASSTVKGLNQLAVLLKGQHELSLARVVIDTYTQTGWMGVHYIRSLICSTASKAIQITITAISQHSIDQSLLC